MKKTTLCLMTALTGVTLLGACSANSMNKDKMMNDKTSMSDKAPKDDKMMDDKKSMDKDKMSDDKMMDDKKSMDKDKMSDDKMMDDKKSMDKDKMSTDKMVNKGEMAPDFTLQGVDGKTYSLSDFKGKKVYLKFWASWCSICLSTLGDADTLAKEAGDDVVVLSVVSPNHNGEKSEQEFKDWYAGLDYKHLPVAMDPSGKLLETYGVRSYPTSAFIGTDGVLVKKHIGFMSAEDIKATLKEVN